MGLLICKTRFSRRRTWSADRLARFLGEFLASIDVLEAGKEHDSPSPRLAHVLHGGGPLSHLSFRTLHGVQES
jgi:hypothetical protein